MNLADLEDAAGNPLFAAAGNMYKANWNWTLSPTTRARASTTRLRLGGALGDRGSVPESERQPADSWRTLVLGTVLVSEGPASKGAGLSSNCFRCCGA